jgi:hypothetical protein
MSAASDSSAIQIEDEPPHEIYANLVGSSNSKSIAAPAAANQTNARGSLHVSPHAQNNSVRVGTGAALISTEDEDLPALSSDSQFMQFYQKSCHETNPSSSPLSYASSKPKRRKCSRATSQQSAAVAPMKQQTTRAERRQIARRERERQIARDKQISMMLHCDVSDEYSSLYSQLHR